MIDLPVLTVVTRGEKKARSGGDTALNGTSLIGKSKTIVLTSFLKIAAF